MLYKSPNKKETTVSYQVTVSKLDVPQLLM